MALLLEWFPAWLRLVGRICCHRVQLRVIWRIHHKQWWNSLVCHTVWHTHTYIIHMIKRSFGLHWFCTSHFLYSLPWPMYLFHNTGQRLGCGKVLLTVSSYGSLGTSFWCQQWELCQLLGTNHLMSTSQSSSATLCGHGRLRQLYSLWLLRTKRASWLIFKFEKGSDAKGQNLFYLFNIKRYT